MPNVFIRFGVNCIILEKLDYSSLVMRASVFIYGNLVFCLLFILNFSLCFCCLFFPKKKTVLFTRCKIFSHVLLFLILNISCLGNSAICLLSDHICICIHISLTKVVVPKIRDSPKYVVIFKWFLRYLIIFKFCQYWNLIKIVKKINIFKAGQTSTKNYFSFDEGYCWVLL